MDEPDLRALIAGRLSRRQLVAIDVLVAAAIVFTVGVNLGAGAWQPSAGIPLWLAWTATLTAGIPLLLRRLWPMSMLALALAHWFLSTLVGVGFVTLFVIAVVLYTVASNRPVMRSLTALIGCVAVSAMVSDDGFLQTVLSGIVFTVAWAVGRVALERRGVAALAADRRARDAVAEERLRIARELHDIVAHSMSLIAVKASVANHVAETNPGEARTALHDIERTSRDALTEMRRMLGVLRSADDGAPVNPAPAPGGLAALADRASLAGVDVDLDVRGVADLPDALGLSVYRIVQEALTNVVRHAAPARCQVVVDGTADVVTIKVTDDGPGLAYAGTPGHGLIGMRERVAIYGGEFSAGPRPGGGFEVRADLPRTEAKT